MNFWDLQQGSSQAVALIDEAGNALSHFDLAQQADAAAGALRELGPRRVGMLLCANRRECVVAYLACLRAGHVPLLVPEGLPGVLQAALCERYRPDWLMGAAVDGTALPGSGLRLRRCHEPGAEPPHPELALLLSTSGSTGSPRLVRISFSALQANAASIAQYLSLAPGERAITALPMHYSYGLSVINSHLQAGAALVLTDHSVLQQEFWDRLQQHAVTSLAGVPYTYQLLHRTGFATRDLPSLRTLTQAGGRLDDRLMAAFHELALQRGWRFFVMYGQTEATARISYVPPGRLGEKIGSIGVALPGGELAVDAATGELVYRGPNVMMGYAQERADLARGDELGGELRTGELGRVDEDGYFYLTGRIKRFVKLSGNRIGLDEVENALQQELGLPVAVGGRDDALLAWIEGGDAQALERATRLLRERFGLHHSLFRLVAVAQLALLPSGKKDYAAMLEQA